MGTLFQTGLRGEGSLLHHLKAYNYRLAHQQSPVHELDFGVASLAGDLRDGLRLCKLADRLSGAATTPTPKRMEREHSIARYFVEAPSELYSLDAR